METLFTGLIGGFIISLIISPLGIPLLTKLKFGQNVRSDGPASHLKKAGTPTMGGIIFLAAAILSLILHGMFTWATGMLLFVTLFTGVLGLIDDYRKVVQKRSLGLQGRYKVIGQLLIVAIFAWYLNAIEHDTAVIVPLTEWELELGSGYFLLLILMLLGTSNAVNLTDGVDGLAAGVVTIALAGFTIIAFLQGLGEVAVFGGVLIGACLGFLVFNVHPAKIFMGDVGSLALGSALAAVAVMTKTELWLIIIGLPLVIETLSVIIQVFVFQTTGKRILKMSPLHHHLELVGWSEWKVVSFFWVFTLITTSFGVLTYL